MRTVACPDSSSALQTEAVVVELLAERPHRLDELRRASLDGVVDSLERDGIVSLKMFDTMPPSAKCSLTPLGHSLAAPLLAIRDAVEQHVEKILERAMRRRL